jgi:myosin heavy subunit
MESIGIDCALQLDIFRLLASILHMGNVVFDNTQQLEEDQVSSATAETAESLRLASDLLGVGAEDLLTCLTKQNMYVGGATIIKMQSYSQVLCNNQCIDECEFWW